MKLIFPAPKGHSSWEQAPGVTGEAKPMDTIPAPLLSPSMTPGPGLPSFSRVGGASSRHDWGQGFSLDMTTGKQETG